MDKSPEDTLGVAWGKIRSKSLVFAEIERKPMMIDLLKMVKREETPDGKLYSYITNIGSFQRRAIFIVSYSFYHKLSLIKGES